MALPHSVAAATVVACRHHPAAASGPSCSSSRKPATRRRMTENLGDGEWGVKRVHARNDRNRQAVPSTRQACAVARSPPSREPRRPGGITGEDQGEECGQGKPELHPLPDLRTGTGRPRFAGAPFLTLDEQVTTPQRHPRDAKKQRAEGFKRSRQRATRNSHDRGQQGTRAAECGHSCRPERRTSKRRDSANHASPVGSAVMI